jgi:hypothetical protein
VPPILEHIQLVSLGKRQGASPDLPTRGCFKKIEADPWIARVIRKPTSVGLVGQGVQLLVSQA